MTTQLVSGPAALPVSVADVKAHLRVDHADEDARIEALIGAAAAHFDGTGVLGRAMITQTWKQMFRYTRKWEPLTVGPFQGLTSIEYYDAGNQLQTANVADFETWIDGDRVLLGPKVDRAWPSIYARPDAVTVTYTAGYGNADTDIPASVRQAILLTVGHWYEHREAVAEGGFKELPMAVDALIGVERVGWYG